MAEARAENVYSEAVLVGPPPVGETELMQPDGSGQAEMEFLGPHTEYDEEEEEKKYYRRMRLGVVKNVVAASLGGMITYSVYLGLLQMQLILHYDETYREVKYGSLGLEDIDNKILMGINVTPIVGLLYTPVLIRFLGTKWMMFLASGIYALFVSTNYWERYYTLVPSAVAIGVSIVPLWASLGNYITRMAQQFYEFVNYKEEQEEQRRTAKGACNRYIIIFQSVFYVIFHLSLVFAELPMLLFLNNFLTDYNHTLCNVQSCGATSSGVITGLNKTVLSRLPPSLLLIKVESVMMGAAFLAMIIFLALCGAAYRPTEEIDLRSIGWGNIFQLPFKHLRDYRIRLLCPFFIYSGFEMLFAVTGLMLSYGVCSVGLENLWALVIAYGLSASIFSALPPLLMWLPRWVPLLTGAALHLCILVGLMIWSPKPRNPDLEPGLLVLIAAWGLGTALNKTGLSTLLGMLYEDKDRLDFVYTIYHWWQAIAIFVVYLWSGLPMRAKLSIVLVTLLVSCLCYLLMERRLIMKVPYRLPRIPRPRHKVKGYRYLEVDDSDESDVDKSEDEMVERDEADRDASSQGSDVDLREGEVQRGGGARRRRDNTYEQAGGMG
ncbi:protein unc-93 homolog B1 [Brienomyrus brachyistius]|uniref:protein unc-93 homolog B1 n=1 Tax=Brienomyrus brachyistius TaxID=42636 RepID=UPI0020B1F1B1|nr:protein unc-93 homolog B1 [Brienomyrus brachyistius]